MKRFGWFDILFPLCVLAFAAGGVTYWNTVFNANTRWFFLALLFITLFFRGEIFLAFRTRYGLILAVYSLWCFSTVAWSLVPTLSLLKSTLFVGVAVTFIGAGQVWAMRKSLHGIFSYLLPIIALVLTASSVGRADPVQIGMVEVYQGLTGNPNYLGILVAMAMPYALWLLYDKWHDKKYRLITFGLLLVLFIALWLSGSRASILCVMSIIMGFMLAVISNKRVFFAISMGFVIFAAVIAVPAVQDALLKRVIYKGQIESEAFISRRDVWSESYANALEGGLIGVGYGVTAGAQNFSFSFSDLTSVGYGREKSNSQLAIWEETGIVGFALYGAFVILIILDLGAGFKNAPDMPTKVKLGLFLGLGLGFVAHSVFEAWWVAPGSPEFSFFFAAIGVGSGLIKRLQLHPRVSPSRSISLTRYTVDSTRFHI